MDSQPNGNDGEHSAQRKGKCRAAPEEISETTPLLDASQPLIQDDDPSASSFRRRRRLILLLATVFFTTLGLCFVVVLILFLLTYSYSPKLSNSVRDEVLNRAVVIRGPDHVDVLNATEGSIWVQIDMRVGLDAGTAIDVVLEADKGEKVDSGSTAIRRTIARWLAGRLRTVTVSADEASLFSNDRLIANMTMPTVSVPLTLDAPDDFSWLTNLSFPVLVNVTDNASDLEVIAQEAWRSGVLLLSASVRHVHVYGGVKGEDGWRRRLNLTQEIVAIPSRIKVPELPGLPLPGKGTPFPGLSDLVTLESFNISSTNHSVYINATASLIDPLPTSLQMKIPSVPFSVSLPDANNTNETVTVTTGQTKPFSLTHPNITLRLSGTVTPLPRSSSPLLSSFLSSYLAGHDAPIVVGTPLLPSLKIPTFFPAPHPKPRILRDVHIKDMRISFHGESVLASGTINAQVVLPSGVNVLVDARKIWPDVLVFDGKVPSEEEFTPSRVIVDNTQSYDEDENDDDRATIPKDPLPSPLPDRAFARIRPDDWLPAKSFPIPDSDNNAYDVTAQVVDVPLEVLPGRDNLLRSFISKVLFSGREGALAGVKGTAAVGVAVAGLPVVDDKDEEEGGVHVFELTRLPFSGTYNIDLAGKKVELPVEATVSHEEVLETGKAKAEVMRQLIENVIIEIPKL
ncbi:hypothetical protein A7U60_g5652 [Sanghuangporus baumii]|uniref:Uncharacterized protein n=1 Tax=Sanghuangporus baumii TaxID=108892 RepID=A0A9Q5HWI9_SANBA|nr:hypothetical protein A7U60_g5652 [Sanghuangporus baumii]